MANQIMVLSYQENSVDGDTVARIYDQLTPFGIELVAIPYREVGLAAGGKETVMPFVKTFGVVEEPKKSESRKRIEQAKRAALEVIDMKTAEGAKAFRAAKDTASPKGAVYPVEDAVVSAKNKDNFFTSKTVQTRDVKMHPCIRCGGIGVQTVLLKDKTEGKILCGTCNGRGAVESFGKLDPANKTQKEVQEAWEKEHRIHPSSKDAA